MEDSFYDILAGHYDNLQMNSSSDKWGPYIYGLISEFCKTTDPAVTDLGCGTGVITNFLASKGMKVTGVDLSPDMLAIASSGDETGTVTWLCADITSYEGDSCDCFISTMDTIGHILEPDDLRNMFASVSELLEEGGIFILDATTRKHFEKTLGDNVFYGSSNTCIQSEPTSKCNKCNNAKYQSRPFNARDSRNYICNNRYRSH